MFRVCFLAVYGDGVYFAVDPTYSAYTQYAQPEQFGKCHVYQARVLVGQSTVGKARLNDPIFEWLVWRRFDPVPDDSRQIYVIFPMFKLIQNT